MNGMTSTLTRFFRHQAQLKSLEHHLIPDLVLHGLQEERTRLEVWCVGCSTGEEPYTLAILLSEILPSGHDFSIEAIDRVPEAVRRAERGIYRSAEVAGMSKRFLERYFLRRGEGYEVRSSLRSRVRFRCEAVESSTERGLYDLVLCRNVLTYAGAADRAGIVRRLWEAMSSYSLLVVGGSESLFGSGSPFEYRSDEWSSAYCKRSPA